jgi:hypothetical protein
LGGASFLRRGLHHPRGGYRGTASRNAPAICLPVRRFRSSCHIEACDAALPLPLFAGETASALRVHHAGRKLGDVARGSSAMHGAFYPPLEGEGRSRSERGGVISPRAQMYRFRRPWAGSGTTETPPRGQTVTPPRPHRRCGASSTADDPPPPGEGKKERGAPDKTRTHFLGRAGVGLGWGQTRVVCMLRLPRKRGASGRGSERSMLVA